MRRHIALAANLVALSACASLGKRPTVAAADGAQDWMNAPGATLAHVYQREMRRALPGLGVGAAIDGLRAAGYDCATGEAHPRHPDPMSVCRKSFATRACQLDQEVALSMTRAIIRKVEASFERDCVGTGRDWPSPKRSAIDDGLAAPPKSK